MCELRGGSYLVVEDCQEVSGVLGHWRDAVELGNLFDVCDLPGGQHRLRAARNLDIKTVESLSAPEGRGGGKLLRRKGAQRTRLSSDVNSALNSVPSALARPPNEQVNRLLCLTPYRATRSSESVSETLGWGPTALGVSAVARISLVDGEELTDAFDAARTFSVSQVLRNSPASSGRCSSVSMDTLAKGGSIARAEKAAYILDKASGRVCNRVLPSEIAFRRRVVGVVCMSLRRV